MLPPELSENIRAKLKAAEANIVGPSVTADNPDTFLDE